MDFNLANTISTQIEKYDEALKYADDDEKDEIDITVLENSHSDFIVWIEFDCVGWCCYGCHDQRKRQD